MLHLGTAEFILEFALEQRAKGKCIDPNLNLHQQACRGLIGGRESHQHFYDFSFLQVGLGGRYCKTSTPSRKQKHTVRSYESQSDITLDHRSYGIKTGKVLKMPNISSTGQKIQLCPVRTTCTMFDKKKKHKYDTYCTTQIKNLRAKSTSSPIQLSQVSLIVSKTKGGFGTSRSVFLGSCFVDTALTEASFHLL